MKVMDLMRFGLVGLLGSTFMWGCTAEPGGELSILRVPVPSESCEIAPDEEVSLASGIFDPTVNTSSQDGATIGFVVKNGLRAADSGSEVNDSGEAIGPAAPNNVLMSGEKASEACAKPTATSCCTRICRYPCETSRQRRAAQRFSAN